jgi:hypothetical protein
VPVTAIQEDGIPARSAPWGATGQAGGAEATAASPAALLGATPSGQDCLDALGRWGRVHGVKITSVLRLAGLPGSSVGNLREAKRPKPETVARVRALIALEEVPSVPLALPLDARLPAPFRERTHAAAPSIRLPDRHPAPARPSITEQVAREAEAAAHRRAAARVIGHQHVIDAPPMPAPAAVQAGLLTTPNDAMRALITGWPDLWRRLISESKAAGQLPGAYFAQAVERGLDALAGDI